MVVLDNGDQFLIGDGDEDQVGHVVHHGTEADVIFTAGNALSHLNGHSMIDINRGQRILLVIKLQRFR